MDEIADYSWSTVFAIVSALLLAWVKRLWSNEDKKVQELKDAEEAYRKAVKSKDADAIAIASRRLQECRKKCR